MNKSTKISLLLLISLLITTVNGDGRDDDPKTLNAAERAIGITPVPLVLSPWKSTIRSWLKVVWMNLRPPVHERVHDHREPGEVVKEAVTKSFETSKETAKQSAKAAGDAVHKTAEKVLKKTVSTNEEL